MVCHKIFGENVKMMCFFSVNENKCDLDWLWNQVFQINDDIRNKRKINFIMDFLTLRNHEIEPKKIKKSNLSSLVEIIELEMKQVCRNLFMLNNYVSTEKNHLIFPCFRIRNFS